MAKCANTVPKGATCPLCEQQHTQPLSRAGSVVVLLGLCAVIGGFAYLAWRDSRGGYGYGY